MSSPRVLQMPPLLSDTAMIVAPSSPSSRAATLPAFPKPCTATLAPFSAIFFSRQASRVTNWTPRAVASLRPWEPPICSGLPVTTPSCVDPTVME